MNDYKEFLKKKELTSPITGLTEIPELNPALFDFQRDIVKWALRRGRAAIFADCGMGKTLMQLEWAKHVPGNVLILAPLAVSSQTIQEGKRFGIEAKYARDQESASGKITITNYEMLSHFEPEKFNAIVLDESSILKAYDGKTRNEIIGSFNKTPFRLACTATPAPNDYMELGNHSEFLGVMSRTEMLSMFFVHDGGETQKWRLKGHAEDKYWKWLCTWSVMIRKPGNLGYSDDKFTLPKLEIIEHVIQATSCGDYLIPLPASSLQERISARRDSINERVKKCAELINKSKEKWVVWCNLNSEGDLLEKEINGAVQVKGSDSLIQKQTMLTRFSDGQERVMVSKPSIAGYGMNWQHVSNVAFVGLSDSYEDFYQAIRRCWRFGQKKQVNCHIVISDMEGAVMANIKRKEEDAEKMAEKMVENMADITKEELTGTKRDISVYEEDVKKSDRYEIYLGDSVEVSKKIKSDSVHYSIFSPPFSSLYTYSNSDRDMGNSKDHTEFFQHFQFLIKEIYRVLIPGRLVSFHCMNLPTSKAHHGYIGLVDFRGDLIRAFLKEGFIYHSEVCIWKDPVTAMQRTKALGLLHKQIKKDSCMSRQGIPDYLVTLRKPGENFEPVCHTNETFPVGVWQQYASPVWMDINPNKTLQFRSAREHKDERHICPLQLEVIERAINLWTNPNDVVFSPFAGIGSEGHVALLKNRKFLGIELKKTYWQTACNNLEIAEKEANSDMLIAV